MNGPRAPQHRRPPGVVDVRIDGAHGDTERLAVILADILERTSGPRRRRNRSGGGQRLYLSVRLPGGRR